MAVTLADISSNARVKDYPGLTVLQVANARIFREPGWEPETRPYSVAPKGQGKNPERAKLVSMARARAVVRDIALMNPFTHFFTGTLSQAVVDRYDAAAVGKKVQTLMRNISYRKGFRYLIVAERHKDGAIHFHGLVIPGSVSLIRATDPHTGRSLSTEQSQPVYNVTDWTLGFSTCIPLYGEYGQVCSYVTKYISKETEKILGKWYLASRDLIRRPETHLVDGLDYDRLLDDNPELPQIPLYRDVCMTILQQPHEGGVSQ